MPWTSAACRKARHCSSETATRATLAGLDIVLTMLQVALWCKCVANFRGGMLPPRRVANHRLRRRSLALERTVRREANGAGMANSRESTLSPRPPLRFRGSREKAGGERLRREVEA